MSAPKDVLDSVLLAPEAVAAWNAVCRRAAATLPRDAVFGTETAFVEGGDLVVCVDVTVGDRPGGVFARIPARLWRWLN